MCFQKSGLAYLKNEMHILLLTQNAAYNKAEI